MESLPACAKDVQLFCYCGEFTRPRNCWKPQSERSRSDFGATLDQTSEASRCSYAFSAMRMPHPYLPMPRRASTYHPAKHIARLMPVEFRRDTEDSFQTNRERQAHNLRIAIRQPFQISHTNRRRDRLSARVMCNGRLTRYCLTRRTSTSE